MCMSICVPVCVHAHICTRLQSIDQYLVSSKAAFNLVTFETGRLTR